MAEKGKVHIEALDQGKGHVIVTLSSKGRGANDYDEVTRYLADGQTWAYSADHLSDSDRAIRIHAVNLNGRSGNPFDYRTLNSMAQVHGLNGACTGFNRAGD